MMFFSESPRRNCLYRFIFEDGIEHALLLLGDKLQEFAQLGAAFLYVIVDESLDAFPVAAFSIRRGVIGIIHYLLIVEGHSLECVIDFPDCFLGYVFAIGLKLLPRKGGIDGEIYRLKLYQSGAIVERSALRTENLAHYPSVTASKYEVGIPHFLDILSQSGFYILFWIIDNLLKFIYHDEATTVCTVKKLKYFAQSIFRSDYLAKLDVEGGSAQYRVVSEGGLYGFHYHSEALQHFLTALCHTVEHGIAKHEDELSEIGSVEDVYGNGDEIVGYHGALEDMIYQCRLSHAPCCR